MAVKRSYHQQKIHQNDLAKLIRRGWTTDMIAEEFGLTVSQVAADFKIIVKQFHAERTEDTKEAITLKLREIAEVKREAWQAWERSTQEQTVIKEETFTSAHGHTSLKYAIEKRKPVGDPRFLALVQECFKAERELQGLDAPKGVSITGHLVNWDVLAKGIPLAGPVPDDVEDEITRAMIALGEKSKAEDPSVIVVPPSPAPPVPAPSRTRTGASRAGAIDVTGKSGGEGVESSRRPKRSPSPKPKAEAKTLDELEGDDP